MTPARHYTDDDIRRWRSVWLGPDKTRGGFTVPWAASYTAYGLWLVTFTAMLFVEWVTPLHVSTPPVWEFAISVLAATLIGGAVDHDRPLRALPKTFLQHLRSPRPTTRTARSDGRYGRVRIEDRS